MSTNTAPVTQERSHLCKIDAMARYPFDQQFQNAVKSLSQFEGETWDTLIDHYKVGQGPVFDQLAALDYPPATVSKYISRLFAMSIADLFELAKDDRLEASPALLVLQTSSSKTVLRKAIQLCASPFAKERAIGVLTLMRKPGLVYRKEAVAALKKMLPTEDSDTVIATLAYALRHLDVEDRSAFLIKAAQSEFASTRFAAAYSLGELNDEFAIQTKIALSSDEDEAVRDWATFGLQLGLVGDQTQREDIRDALFARIDDPFEDARYEAIEGLARCQDPRVIPSLIKALEQPEVWDLAIEAAAAMADPALFPALTKLRTWWQDGSRPDRLDIALACCAPKATAPL
ncbi:MAG: HEAT repeat domain-containing protein [Cyanobacteria bacterium SZAS LIN-2]|nr:HEAT repeat domain-containing protein [Cyanobacteria bacterium SZAS LIN-2]